MRRLSSLARCIPKSFQTATESVGSAAHVGDVPRGCVSPLMWVQRLRTPTPKAPAPEFPSWVAKTAKLLFIHGRRIAIRFLVGLMNASASEALCELLNLWPDTETALVSGDSKKGSWKKKQKTLARTASFFVQCCSARLLSRINYHLRQGRCVCTYISHSISCITQKLLDWHQQKKIKKNPGTVDWLEERVIGVSLKVPFFITQKY